MVIQDLEALIALKRNGTMAKAAIDLHISQSAVSRRISQLEYYAGAKLIERKGRKVVFTPFGINLVERAFPLVSDLKNVFLERPEGQIQNITIAIAESIMISWGARAVAKVLARMPELNLEIQVHRDRHCVEQVRAGEAMLGLVPGLCPDETLRGDPFIEEPMVIVPAELKRFKLNQSDTVKVIAINRDSETWSSVVKRIDKFSLQSKIKIEVVRRLESFAGIVQMAKAGFGHGLVPIGVARALGVSKLGIIPFPEPGITRPVSLIGRTSTMAKPLIQRFERNLSIQIDNSFKF